MSNLQASRLPLQTLAGRLSWTMTLAFLAGVSWAQSPAIERAKTAMEGSWRLEEWVVDGEPLRPPQVDGRLSEHDGKLILEHDGGRRKLIYEGGTFTYVENGAPLRRWRRIVSE